MNYENIIHRSPDPEAPEGFVLQETGPAGDSTYVLMDLVHTECGAVVQSDIATPFYSQEGLDSLAAGHVCSD